MTMLLLKFIVAQSPFQELYKLLIVVYSTCLRGLPLAAFSGSLLEGHILVEHLKRESHPNAGEFDVASCSIEMGHPGFILTSPMNHHQLLISADQDIFFDAGDRRIIGQLLHLVVIF